MKRIIQQSVSLPAPAGRLFDMYLDPALHSEIVGGPAMIGTAVGSEFRILDGRITGRTVAVMPKEHIVQLWRESAWKPEERDSIVVMSFLPDGRFGKIEMTQLDVPEARIEEISRAWLQRYWRPWKAYLDKEQKKEQKSAA